ncbi:MAG: hypothetical protein QME81_10425 [bacterium]|nr:hypothetical protein [bacterium]
MDKLKDLWKRTKFHHNELEKKIADNYLNFLREVARYYLKEDRRVFFRENRVVHWGEGDFGRLLIEENEDVSEVFEDYILEVEFEPEIQLPLTEGYIEITTGNLDAIKYRVDEW